MCTIMPFWGFGEKLTARFRSRAASQREVDKLMEYERNSQIEVSLDRLAFGADSGFYYVRDTSSILWGSTAYQRPLLIVKKSQLRPDQIDFMERKRAETMAKIY